MEAKNILKILILLMSFSLLLFKAYSQDDVKTEETTNYNPILKLSYLKNTDDIRVLKCTISARLKGKWIPIENADLAFYAGTDSLVALGKKTSDAEGIAIIEIDKEVSLPEDEYGDCTYTVEYEGTENSKAKSKEITIVDIQMEITLEEIDSVKTITVKAGKKGPEGEVVAVTGEDVNVYVKRLYSNLKVGEIYLDEDEGQGSLEYELIPGDSLGNIVLIARFDDHEEYGNVEKRQTINWGTPVSYAIIDTPREIWTNEAPLWMTITVLIFVFGVWYHLILVFVRMWKIKKIGKNLL